MSFVTGSRKPEVEGLQLEIGSGTTGSQYGLGITTALYDLPRQNIARAIELQHAGQNFHQISAEEANERYGIDGALEFDEPISWKKADIMAEYKRKEMERMQLIEQGDTGIIRKLAFLSGNLSAEALDPINLAFMFLPVVGEVKFAKLATKVGTGKARALVGAADAMAGAAVVEPFSYLSKSFGEQNEYSVKNTISNFAFSAVLGITLRTAGGRIKDAVTGKYNPRTALDFMDAQGEVKAINRIHLESVDAAIRTVDVLHVSKGKMKYGSPEWKKAVSVETMKYMNSNTVELDRVKRVLEDLTPEVKREAFSEAMNNLLYGEAMSGPGKVIEMDAFIRMDREIAKIWKKTRVEIQVNKARKARKQKPLPDTAEETVIDAATASVIQTDASVPGVKYKQVAEGAEIEFTNREDHIEIWAPENPKAKPLQKQARAALIKGKANDALARNQRIKVNGTMLSPSETRLLALGEGGLHEPVARGQTANELARAEAIERGELDDIDPEHIDMSTPETRREGALVEAEAINAQADIELALIAELVGPDDLGRIKKISQETGADPRGLAEAASTDSTLLSRIEGGQVDALEAVEGKGKIEVPRPKAPSDTRLTEDPLAATAGTIKKRARAEAAAETKLKKAIQDEKDRVASQEAEAQIAKAVAEENAAKDAAAARAKEFESLSPEEKAARKKVLDDRLEADRKANREAAIRLRADNEAAAKARIEKLEQDFQREKALRQARESAEDFEAPGNRQAQIEADIQKRILGRSAEDTFDVGDALDGIPPKEKVIGDKPGPADPADVDNLIALLDDSPTGAPAQLKADTIKGMEAPSHAKAITKTTDALIKCAIKNPKGTK